MIAVPTLRVSVTVAIPLTDSAVPTIFPTVISGELIKPFAFVGVLHATIFMPGTA